MTDGLLTIGAFSRASFVSAEVAQIVAALQSEPAALVNTPVHLRSEKATRTLTITGEVTEADFATWLGTAFTRPSRCGSSTW